MDRETGTHLIVIGLLAVAALALLFGVDVTLSDRPGIRMSLPASVGNWTGKRVFFCHNPGCLWSGTLDFSEPAPVCPRCGGPLSAATLSETRQLPSDTRFRRALYTDTAGRQILVAVVLSGRERRSIHRPQRCLVAQGYDIVDSDTVRIPLPGRRPLPVMVLTTLRQTGDARGPEGVRRERHAYWFVGRGRETPYHLVRMFWMAWDRMFHGVAHRWAYIIVQCPGADEKDVFLDTVSDFLGAWYPAVRLH